MLRSLGPLLILKLDGVVIVHQLTAAQQLKLNHDTVLVTSPRDIMQLLNLSSQLQHQAVGNEQTDGTANLSQAYYSTFAL